MYGTWSTQMREAPGDKAWWKSINTLIRNEDDQVPDEERFNTRPEAALTGASLWCGIVLLLTGYVLWVPE